ncbi:MAG TPA: DUF2971 domain-containing protein [Anaerolineales bacterium]|nr:DUF2971 domain-containing protein [Anaerolineales bacterium]
MSKIKQKEIPSFLYHYTKIENLALILKNKTIMFSSLDTVNDLTEGETSDYGSLGHFVFVSCWTATSKEHIPMWNMYTPDMAGVRIKLPTDPFQRYGKSFVPVKELFYQKEYSVQPAPLESHRIIYTNDESLLKPKFAEIRSPKEATLNLNAVGRYKPKVWSFEKEWRYIFWILPKKLISFGNESDSDEKFFQAIKNFGKKQIPMKQYFLKIRDESFEQMQIVLGPKCSEGDKAIVKALIYSYNPKANFKSSELTGNIRN